MNDGMQARRNAERRQLHNAVPATGRRKNPTKEECEAAGFFCKTALKAMGLEPVHKETRYADYWQGHGWVRAYCKAECQPIPGHRPDRVVSALIDLVSALDALDAQPAGGWPIEEFRALEARLRAARQAARAVAATYACGVPRLPVFPDDGGEYDGPEDAPGVHGKAKEPRE